MVNAKPEKSESNNDFGAASILGATHFGEDTNEPTRRRTPTDFGSFGNSK